MTILSFSNIIYAFGSVSSNESGEIQMNKMLSCECFVVCQIDGSTLKTLCMQHGPLQSFHLYLNQSIALAKYSTREEANKVFI
jgi:hypothetical protein